MATIYTMYYNIKKILGILPTQCIYVFRMVLTITAIISLNNINPLGFVPET
jgi:hypothetical protein